MAVQKGNEACEDGTMPTIDALNKICILELHPSKFVMCRHKVKVKLPSIIMLWRAGKSINKLQH